MEANPAGFGLYDYSIGILRSLNNADIEEPRVM
jgi:hypothetical protein